MQIYRLPNSNLQKVEKDKNQNKQTPYTHKTQHVINQNI